MIRGVKALVDHNKINEEWPGKGEDEKKIVYSTGPGLSGAVHWSMITATLIGGVEELSSHQTSTNKSTKTDTTPISDKSQLCVYLSVFSFLSFIFSLLLRPYLQTSFMLSAVGVKFLF